MKTSRSDVVTARASDYPTKSVADIRGKRIALPESASSMASPLSPIGAGWGVNKKDSRRFDVPLTDATRMHGIVQGDSAFYLKSNT